MSLSGGDEGDYRTWVTVHAKTEFEDNEEALDSLVNLKEVNFGDVFADRSTELDSDSNDGISISFIDNEAENYLLLRADDDGVLKITLQLHSEVIGRGPEILSRVLEQCGSITIDNKHGGKYYDHSFGSLEIPLDNEAMPYELSGIRVTHENSDVIIQVANTESSKIAVLIKTEPDAEFSDSIPDDLMDVEIHVMDEVVSEFGHD